MAASTAQIAQPAAPEFLPDLDSFIIEDGKPVDGIYSEKQMRLLTEPLYGVWSGPPDGKTFVAMANVGVLHTDGEPPIVPDVLLAVGVRQGQDMTSKANKSYFVWLRGKVPDVAIEVVSNQEGAEDTTKLVDYARIHVPYYVIFDPEKHLGKAVLRVFELRGNKYRRLAQPWFFEETGLGLELWQGSYENLNALWIRWRDRDRNLILTGAEKAKKESKRAKKASKRATDALELLDVERRASEKKDRTLEQLRARLRELGDNPPV